VNGINRQMFEPHRFNCQRPWQARCGQCGKLLTNRSAKPKGQPLRCKRCQAMVEMAAYFELKEEKVA
jgi:phage FluMu protein Com